MAVDASAHALDERLFETPLTDSERALRDTFVNEYLKDFDPFQAALRCGFNFAFAMDWAKRLMQEGYVQRAIAYLTRQPTDETARAARDAEQKALVESVLLEAMQRGPYASRVSAVREFNAMKGWSKPDASADAEQSLIDALKEFSTKAPV